MIKNNMHAEITDVTVVQKKLMLKKIPNCNSMTEDRYLSRCLVHALSFGDSHKLGIEDGLVGLRWKVAQSKVASPTSRSSQMLILFYFIFLFYPH